MTTKQAALQHFDPAVFERISKGTFAVLCWHLANRASGEADNDGAAERTMLEELGVLCTQGILPMSALVNLVK